MEDIKVFALDDDGNRIEPNHPEQENNVEQEAAAEVEPQKIEVNDGIRKENEEQQNVEEQEESEANDIQEQEEVEEPEKDDNWFFNKLKERYEVEVNSVDDLKNVLSNSEKESLPEDVEKYLQYRKDTGRSFSDFTKLQKDWSSVSDSEVIREYYEKTKPHLDREDIEHILNENFSYDNDLDDEKDIKAKKIAYKEALYEARNHFEGLKDKYKVPLESSAADVPKEYKEAFSFYNEYKQKTEQQEEIQKDLSSVFTKKTEEFFNEDFKGFEYRVGDKNFLLKPNDIDKVKTAQSNVQNFVSMHVDEGGKLKDAAGYHSALFGAMNPNIIAKHFYDLGKAEATGEIVKETKNIDMSVRENSVSESNGTKFKVLENDDQFSFKIRKRN